MYRICLLFSLITLLASCTGRNDGNNFKDYQVKGNVKRITELEYPIKYEDGKPIQPESSSFVSKKISNYNKDNECTDEIFLLANGDKLGTTINEYKNGLLVKETAYDPEGIVSIVETISINENEVELEMFTLETNQRVKGLAIYENGYMVSLTYPEIEFKFTYDKDGNKTSYTLKDPFGKLSAEIEYLEYDDRGNWTIKIERRKGCDQDDIYVTRIIEYYD